jgi:hypothetical protein
VSSQDYANAVRPMITLASYPNVPLPDKQNAM